MPQPGRFRKILLACKDGLGCLDAADSAAALALAVEGEVLVLHVVHPKKYLD
ncbi:MAG: hypothetical protein KME03_13680 [Aphanocapsa lilacina HA4352-LM1]|jgi:hypothetical protein|nr:hypothetical protein [Aphanocapsa lilacina HA4352-LM1]